MSAYDVDFMVLEILLDGLEDEISVCMSKCNKIDVGGRGGDDIVSGFVINTSLTNNSGIDGIDASTRTTHKMRIEDVDGNDNDEEIGRQPRMF